MTEDQINSIRFILSDLTSAVDEVDDELSEKSVESLTDSIRQNLRELEEILPKETWWFRRDDGYTFSAELSAGEMPSGKFCREAGIISMAREEKYLARLIEESENVQ